ncbi:hypothetical protein, partial [Vibrio cidicii]|uniref:hypothetical protein n=1 Tax=Vibrio cidicii TaxID=1763883 RepID=UPI0037048BE1
MKKKGRIFVIDGNHALHRVWFTLRTGRPTLLLVLSVSFVSVIHTVPKHLLAVKCNQHMGGLDGHGVFAYQAGECIWKCLFDRPA